MHFPYKHPSRCHGRFGSFPIGRGAFAEWRLTYQMSVEVLAQGAVERILDPTDDAKSSLKDLLESIKTSQQAEFLEQFSKKFKGLRELERRQIQRNLEILESETTMEGVHQQLLLLQTTLEARAPREQGAGVRAASEMKEEASFFEQTGDALERAADRILPEKVSERLTRNQKIAVLAAGTAGVALAGYALYRGMKWLFRRGKGARDAASDAVRKVEGGFWKKTLLYSAVGIGAFFGIKWLIEYADKRFALGIGEKIKELKGGIEELKNAGLESAKGIAEGVKGTFTFDKPWEQYGLTEEKYKEAVAAYRIRDHEGILRAFGPRQGQTSREYREFLQNMGERYEEIDVEGFRYKEVSPAFETYEDEMANALSVVSEWARDHETELMIAASVLALKTNLLSVLGNTTMAVGAKSAETATFLGGLAKEHPVAAFFALGGGVLGIRMLVSDARQGEQLWMPANASLLVQVLKERSESVIHPLGAVSIPPETLSALHGAALKIKDKISDVAQWVSGELEKLLPTLDKIVSDYLKGSRADYVLSQHEESFDDLENELERKIRELRNVTEERQKGHALNCRNALILFREYKDLYQSFVLQRMDREWMGQAQNDDVVVTQEIVEAKMKELQSALGAEGVDILLDEKDDIVWWRNDRGRQRSLSVHPRVQNEREIIARTNELYYGESTPTVVLQGVVARFREMARESAAAGPEEVLGSDSLAIVINGVAYIVQGWRTGGAVRYFAAPVDLLFPGGIEYSEEGRVERKNWQGWKVEFGEGGMEAVVMTVSAAVAERLLRFSLIGGGNLPLRGGKVVVGAKRLGLLTIKINPITSPLHLAFRRIPRIARDTRLWLGFASHLPTEAGKGMGLLDRLSKGRYINKLLLELNVRPEEIAAILDPRTGMGRLQWLGRRLDITTHHQSDLVGALRSWMVRVRDTVTGRRFMRSARGWMGDMPRAEYASWMWEELVKRAEEPLKIMGEQQIWRGKKPDAREYLEAAARAMLGEKADAYTVLLRVPELAQLDNGGELARSLVGAQDVIDELKGSKSAILEALAHNPELAHAFGEHPEAFRRFVQGYKAGDVIDNARLIGELDDAYSTLRSGGRAAEAVPSASAEAPAPVRSSAEVPELGVRRPPPKEPPAPTGSISETPKTPPAPPPQSAEPPRSTDAATETAEGARRRFGFPEDSIPEGHSRPGSLMDQLTRGVHGESGVRLDSVDEPLTAASWTRMVDEAFGPDPKETAHLTRTAQEILSEVDDGAKLLRYRPAIYLLASGENAEDIAKLLKEAHAINGISGAKRAARYLFAIGSDLPESARAAMVSADAIKVVSEGTAGNPAAIARFLGGLAKSAEEVTTEGVVKAIQQMSHWQEAGRLARGFFVVGVGADVFFTGLSIRDAVVSAGERARQREALARELLKLGLTSEDGKSFEGYGVTITLTEMEDTDFEEHLLHAGIGGGSTAIALLAPSFSLGPGGLLVAGVVITSSIAVSTIANAVEQRRHMEFLQKMGATAPWLLALLGTEGTIRQSTGQTLAEYHSGITDMDMLELATISTDPETPSALRTVERLSENREEREKLRDDLLRTYAYRVMAQNYADLLPELHMGVLGERLEEREGVAASERSKEIDVLSSFFAPDSPFMRPGGGYERIVKPYIILKLHSLTAGERVKFAVTQKLDTSEIEGDWDFWNWWFDNRVISDRELERATEEGMLLYLNHLRELRYRDVKRSMKVMEGEEEQRLHTKRPPLSLTQIDERLALYRQSLRESMHDELQDFRASNFIFNTHPDEIVFGDGEETIAERILKGRVERVSRRRLVHSAEAAGKGYSVPGVSDREMGIGEFALQYLRPKQRPSDREALKRRSPTPDEAAAEGLFTFDQLEEMGEDIPSFLREFRMNVGQRLENVIRLVSNPALTEPELRQLARSASNDLEFFLNIYRHEQFYRDYFVRWRHAPDTQIPDRNLNLRSSADTLLADDSVRFVRLLKEWSESNEPLFPPPFFDMLRRRAEERRKGSDQTLVREARPRGFNDIPGYDSGNPNLRLYTFDASAVREAGRGLKRAAAQLSPLEEQLGVLPRDPLLQHFALQSRSSNVRARLPNAPERGMVMDHHGRQEPLVLKKNVDILLAVTHDEYMEIMRELHLSGKFWPLREHLLRSRILVVEDVTSPTSFDARRQ